MLVLEVCGPIVALALAPIEMSFHCRILVLAIRFLAPTFDIPLWLFYGLDSSLDPCVLVVVCMGLAYVRLLSVTSHLVLGVEVQLV